MPRTTNNLNSNKTNKIAEKKTENVNIEQINSEEILKKNQELEDKVNNLTSMLEKLLEKQNNDSSEKGTEVKQESKNKEFQAYTNIEPTKRILLMNMVHAGGTFVTHNNKPVRFDYFGHIQPVRFEDLESLVTKYRNYFENLELRILDDEAVDALYLRHSYNKFNITKEEMEEIIELDSQTMVKKIKSLSSALQESVLSLIITGVAKNDSRYMDKNKWDILNNAFNINVQEFASRYVI